MTHKPTDKSFGNTYLSVNTKFAILLRLKQIGEALTYKSKRT